MCPLAAALQPDAGVVVDGAGRELHLVVSPDGNLALALDGVDVPPRDALAVGLAVADGRRLGEEVPGALEHVDVGLALVAGGGDDEVGLHHLLAVEGALGGNVLQLLHPELDLVVVDGLDAVDLAAAHDAVRPLGVVGAEHATLVVQVLVELLDELEADDAVVSSAGLGEEVVAVPGRPGEHHVDVLGVEDGVDKGGVVAGAEELLAHDEPDLGVGVEVLDVVEDLGGALPGAHHGHVVGSLALAQQLGHRLGVLRRVDDALVLGGEVSGDGGLAAGGEEHVAAAEGRRLVGAEVERLDGEGLDALGGRPRGRDRGDLVVVLDHVAEERGGPAQVVLVLDAGGQERAQVGKVNQAVVLV